LNRWRHPLLLRLLAAALGGVFVYASLDKIAAPAEFARIVYRYRLLGPNALVGPLPANLLAVTLPWIEALAGVLLLLGVWRREAALVAGLLLLVFLGAVGWMLFQGIDLANCGCFTVSGEGRGTGWGLILEDLGLLALALASALPQVSPPVAAGPEEPAGG